MNAGGENLFSANVWPTQFGLEVNSADITAPRTSYLVRTLSFGHISHSWRPGVRPVAGAGNYCDMLLPEQFEVRVCSQACSLEDIVHIHSLLAALSHS